LGFIEFNIQYSPKPPQSEDNVRITAFVVSARTSVKRVLLNYSIQDGPYNELLMEAEGSKYEAIIPNQPDGTKVTFYVSAIDSEDLTRVSDQVKYVVGQWFDIPPIFFEILVLILIFVVLIILSIKGK